MTSQPLEHLQSLPYCWWFRNPANQLRLVLYPIIYRVLYIPGGCLLLESNIAVDLAGGFSPCHVAGIQRRGMGHTRGHLENAVWLPQNSGMQVMDVEKCEDAKDFALKIGDSWKHNPSKPYKKLLKEGENLELKCLESLVNMGWQFTATVGSLKAAKVLNFPINHFLKLPNGLTLNMELHNTCLTLARLVSL